MIHNKKDKGKGRLVPVPPSNFFAPNSQATEETNKRKRAHSSSSQGGSSSTAFEPSQSQNRSSSSATRKRVRTDNTDVVLDQEENTPVDSPQGTTDPSSPAITELTASIESAIADLPDSAQKSKRLASWVWEHFSKAKIQPREDLGAGRFAYVCQFTLNGRPCGKPGE
jgi:hypothetical protein